MDIKLYNKKRKLMTKIVKDILLIDQFFLVNKNKLDIVDIKKNILITVQDLLSLLKTDKTKDKKKKNK